MIFLTCPSCEAKIKMKWVNEGDQLVCFKCKTTATISRDRNNRFILEEEFLEDLEDIVEDIDFEFDDDFLDEEYGEEFEDDFDFFSDEGVEFVPTDEDLDSYGVEIAVDAFDDEFDTESNYEDEDEFGTSFEEYEEDDDLYDDYDYDEDEIEFALEEGEYHAQIDLEGPIREYNVQVEYEDDEDEDDFDDDEDEEDEEDSEYDVEIITEDDED